MGLLVPPVEDRERQFKVSGHHPNVIHIRLVDHLRRRWHHLDGSQVAAKHLVLDALLVAPWRFKVAGRADGVRFRFL